MIKCIATCSKLKDILFWHFNKKGLYTVNSEYKLFLNTEILLDSSSENLIGVIWCGI